MEYSKLVTKLADNMYPESWLKSLGWDSRYIFALRDDVSITIEEMPEREDNKISDEHTENFINKSASYHYYALKYNGAIIKNVCLYMVDGARAYIPVPSRLADTHIEDDNLIIGVIVDRLTFDSRYAYEDTTNYLNRSGFSYQESLIK